VAKLEHKLFSRGEFEALLRHEAERCRRIAQERYCEGDLPRGLLFHATRIDPRFDASAGPSVLRVPANAILALEEVLPHLWREDGHVRAWIDLAPEAVTEDATVLEVYWADDWANSIFVGEDAFPGEPFKLSGPALPHDWTEGSPIPRVRLPRVDVIPPSSFC
jgi:hypothetical protein